MKNFDFDLDIYNRRHLKNHNFNKTLLGNPEDCRTCHLINLAYNQKELKVLLKKLSRAVAFDMGNTTECRSYTVRKEAMKLLKKVK